jgi:hypothetical protein
MMETGMRYGRAGALALVIAGVVWAVATTLGETGTDPGILTRSFGLLGLILLAVGIGGLIKMLIDTYASEELAA